MRESGEAEGCVGNEFLTPETKGADVEDGEEASRVGAERRERVIAMVLIGFIFVVVDFV